MRYSAMFLAGGLAMAALGVAPARADVLITVDKSTQVVTVAVDGATRWEWKVSTGRIGHDTPNGTFHALWLDADHHSKKYDDAPMPHSIFFTDLGHALHGTFATRQLGMPASHGCVRLEPANATQLFALVKQQGTRNTTIVITGDAREALNRTHRPAAPAAAAAPARANDPYLGGRDGAHQRRHRPVRAAAALSAAGRPADLSPGVRAARGGARRPAELPAVPPRRRRVRQLAPSLRQPLVPRPHYRPFARPSVGAQMAFGDDAQRCRNEAGRPRLITLARRRKVRPENNFMRYLGWAVAAFVAIAAGPQANANVLITVDKSTQQMTVDVNGVPRWHWRVSTGAAGYDTPSGTFRAFRMEASHFSKEFDDAPMPHSIFFTKRGHAVHGYLNTSHLGLPVSHGCVRLDPQNATALYALVKQEGVLNTTVVITGHIPDAGVARRAPPAQPYEATTQPQYQPQYQQPSRIRRPSHIRRRRPRTARTAATTVSCRRPPTAGRRRRRPATRRSRGRTETAGSRNNETFCPLRRRYDIRHRRRRPS